MPTQSLMTSTERPLRSPAGPVHSHVRHVVPERNRSRSALCGRRTTRGVLPTHHDEPDLCPDCLALLDR